MRTRIVTEPEEQERIYSFLEDIKLIIMTIKILFVRESTEGFSEKVSKVKNTDSDSQ